MFFHIVEIVFHIFISYLLHTDKCMQHTRFSQHEHQTVSVESITEHFMPCTMPCAGAIRSADPSRSAPPPPSARALTLASESWVAAKPARRRVRPSRVSVRWMSYHYRRRDSANLIRLHVRSASWADEMINHLRPVSPKYNRRLRLLLFFFCRKTGGCVVAGHVNKLFPSKNNRSGQLFFGETGL